MLSSCDGRYVYRKPNLTRCPCRFLRTILDSSKIKAKLLSFDQPPGRASNVILEDRGESNATVYEIKQVR